jgi:hypothetical protein
MNRKVLSGEYTINRKGDDGTLDQSPCSCQEKK